MAVLCYTLFFIVSLPVWVCFAKCIAEMLAITVQTVGDLIVS